MSDPIKTVYFHGPQVSLGGDTEKAMRFSQLTYAPGDRWEMSQWNYRGCIAIYVLEGDEFTLDHIDLTGGGSAFKGAPTNSAPGTSIDSHTWSPLGSSIVSVVL